MYNIRVFNIYIYIGVCLNFKVLYKLVLLSVYINPHFQSPFIGCKFQLTQLENLHSGWHVSQHKYAHHHWLYWRAAFKTMEVC